MYSFSLGLSHVGIGAIHQILTLASLTLQTFRVGSAVELSRLPCVVFRMSFYFWDHTLLSSWVNPLDCLLNIGPMPFKKILSVDDYVLFLCFFFVAFILNTHPLSVLMGTKLKLRRADGSVLTVLFSCTVPIVLWDACTATKLKSQVEDIYGAGWLIALSCSKACPDSWTLEGAQMSYNLDVHGWDQMV